MLELDRPGHQHMAVALAPCDHEIAAGQGHGHLPFGEVEAMRRDCGCAGGGAAGPGQPGAALPYSEPDMAAIDHMGERDIGALGEDRMILEQRTDARKIMRIHILYPEDRMRIAHIDGG